MASFEEIAQTARSQPVVVSLPSLAQFYLDDFEIYKSVDGFQRDLYDPNHLFERDVIIDDGTRDPSFVRMTCDEETVTHRLNGVVDWADPDHHERLQRELLPQSAIKDYIQRRVSTEEFVALVIVDGLSYETIRSMNLPAQPVVVDGLTATEPGFRRVIYGANNTSMYASLLLEGFNKKFGFTYWDRGQEPLSTELHESMGNSIHRIRDFDEAVSILEESYPFGGRSYVQITRMGFDQDSHNRKEKPNREAIREQLLTDIQTLEQSAASLVESYRIFVTADHGILWREDLPDNPPVVYDETAHHPRHVEGVSNLSHSRTINGDSQTTASLAYPYLARDLKHTEWGVHGGCSYYESIVPLIEFSGDSS